MGKIYGYYEWDDSVGSPGHRDDGSLHQNLYNEDRVLVGHARFIPDDQRREDEDEYSYENTYVTSDYRRESEETDELTEAIAQLLVALAAVGIAKAAPHVKRWWQEQVRPAVSRQASKIRSLGRKKKTTVEVLEPAAGPTTGVEVDRRQIMSQKEAMSRTIAALAARAYSDEQLRMVKSARIVGVEDYSEIERAIAELPPAQLQALMVAMVKNPALLEDGSLANLASMLNTSTQLLELVPEPGRREEPNS